jgi:type II secretory pathway pseudopilin PulG
MLQKLWNDEAGAIVSAEIVLVATILVIGSIVGLKNVRDAVVTELSDVAQAIANVSQSYSYSGIDGHASGTAGSFFQDALDFCDTTTDEDAGAVNSKCVNVCAAGGLETDAVP